jgi:hypothetical protein
MQPENKTSAQKNNTLNLLAEILPLVAAREPASQKTQGVSKVVTKCPSAFILA